MFLGEDVRGGGTSGVEGHHGRDVIVGVRDVRGSVERGVRVMSGT